VLVAHDLAHELQIVGPGPVDVVEDEEQR
jgi:hypothetical protein